MFFFVCFHLNVAQILGIVVYLVWQDLLNVYMKRQFYLSKCLTDINNNAVIHDLCVRGKINYLINCRVDNKQHWVMQKMLNVYMTTVLSE